MSAPFLYIVNVADAEALERQRQALRTEAMVTCKRHMTDRGERIRAYRDFGITRFGRSIDDHEAIADCLRGLIHGVTYEIRNLRPWQRGAAYRLQFDRWRLIGMRLAELRLARARNRRQKRKDRA